MSLPLMARTRAGQYHTRGLPVSVGRCLVRVPPSYRWHSTSMNCVQFFRSSDLSPLQVNIVGETLV